MVEQHGSRRKKMRELLRLYMAGVHGFVDGRGRPEGRRVDRSTCCLSLEGVGLVYNIAVLFARQAQNNRNNSKPPESQCRSREAETLFATSAFC